MGQAAQEALLECRLYFYFLGMLLLCEIRRLQPKTCPLSQYCVVDFFLPCPGHCEISLKAPPIVSHHLLALSTCLAGHNLMRSPWLLYYIHLLLVNNETTQTCEAFTSQLNIQAVCISYLRGAICKYPIELTLLSRFFNAANAEDCGKSIRIPYMHLYKKGYFSGSSSCRRKSDFPLVS